MNENVFVAYYRSILNDFNTKATVALFDNDNQKESVYQAALDQISNVAADVERCITLWAVLQPDQRQADANLLNGECGVLTLGELSTLAHKHRSNYTMTRILSTYAVTHYGENHGIYFVDTDELRAAYAQIRESAEALLEQINTAPVADSVITSWLTPDENREIYATIESVNLHSIRR